MNTNIQNKRIAEDSLNKTLKMLNDTKSTKNEALNEAEEVDVVLAIASTQLVEAKGEIFHIMIQLSKAEEATTLAESKASIERSKKKNKLKLRTLL